MQSKRKSPCVGKRPPPSLQRVWDIIERIEVGMLTTQFAGGVRARPVQARLDGSGYIHVLTDVHSAKKGEIGVSPNVGLVVIDGKQKAYLSITGRASIIRDAVTIKALWRTTDTAWWPAGPADPNVRLLRVEPLKAELWDGPASTALELFEFARALVTKRQPKLGQNRKVTIEI
jgi:general stress protein 26